MPNLRKALEIKLDQNQAILLISIEAIWLLFYLFLFIIFFFVRKREPYKSRSCIPLFVTIISICSISISILINTSKYMLLSNNQNEKQDLDFFGGEWYETTFVLLSHIQFFIFVPLLSVTVCAPVAQNVRYLIVIAFNEQKAHLFQKRMKNFTETLNTKFESSMRWRKEISNFDCDTELKSSRKPVKPHTTSKSLNLDQDTLPNKEIPLRKRIVRDRVEGAKRVHTSGSLSIEGRVARDLRKDSLIANAIEKIKTDESLSDSDTPVREESKCSENIKKIQLLSDSTPEEKIDIKAEEKEEDFGKELQDIKTGKDPKAESKLFKSSFLKKVSSQDFRNSNNLILNEIEPPGKEAIESTQVQNVNTNRRANLGNIHHDKSFNLSMTSIVSITSEIEEEQKVHGKKKVPKRRFDRQSVRMLSKWMQGDIGKQSTETPIEDKQKSTLYYQTEIPSVFFRIIKYFASPISIYLFLMLIGILYVVWSIIEYFGMGVRSQFFKPNDPVESLSWGIIIVYLLVIVSLIAFIPIDFFFNRKRLRNRWNDTKELIKATNTRNVLKFRQISDLAYFWFIGSDIYRFRIEFYLHSFILALYISIIILFISIQAITGQEESIAALLIFSLINTMPHLSMTAFPTLITLYSIAKIAFDSSKFKLYILDTISCTLPKWLFRIVCCPYISLVGICNSHPCLWRFESESNIEDILDRNKKKEVTSVCCFTVFSNFTQRAGTSTPRLSRQEEDILTRELKDTNVYNLLKEYAKSEFAIENVLVWNEIQLYKKQSTLKDKVVHASSLYITYVKEHATMEVNICKQTRETLHDSITICKKDNKAITIHRKHTILDAAITRLEKEISVNVCDTFFRFCETRPFVEYKQKSSARDELLKIGHFV